MSVGIVRIRYSVRFVGNRKTKSGSKIHKKGGKRKGEKNEDVRRVQEDRKLYIVFGCYIFFLFSFFIFFTVIATCKIEIKQFVSQ